MTESFMSIMFGRRRQEQTLLDEAQWTNRTGWNASEIDKDVLYWPQSMNAFYERLAAYAQTLARACINFGTVL
jgi:hypothetical protein